MVQGVKALCKMHDAVLSDEYKRYGRPVKLTRLSVSGAALACVVPCRNCPHFGSLH